jgi:predicted transcriptional regulator of viral defense system
MPSTPAEHVRQLIRHHGVLRSRDLAAHGIPREYLRRLLAEGILQRPTRGIYVLADAKPTENQSLVEACLRVPHGIVCLLSALRFHHLTTQSPFETWLAIDSKARLPRVDYPPIRFVRFSGPALTHGVEEHRVQKATIRVTSPARTVVDCFVYRNKIGLDVALEALRDCRRKKLATMDELYSVAQDRRMGRVMRPYLESVA